MCVRRKSNTTSHTTLRMDNGLKGGAACLHRSKKSLFKSKDVRKTLKSSSSSCQDCNRLKKTGQPLPETAEDSSSEVYVCVSCGHLACNEHAKKHSEAARTGDSHPFILSIDNGLLRCHPCDVDLEPLEDPSDPVRLFYNDYKSFTKNKAETQQRKEANSKSANEKVQPCSSDETNKDNDAKPVTKKTAEPKKEESRVRKLVSNVVKMNGNGNSLMSEDTMRPAKGLTNLGNTCFFNSVMQCIMHTHHLQYYFERFGRVEALNFKEDFTVLVNEDKIRLKEASIRVSADDAPLNMVLKGFLSEFRCGTAPSPSSLFSQIARKAPRFKGWQQQDAHELLRYLLDGLRSEEQEWYKNGIAAHLGVSPKTNPKKLDPAVVKAAKGYLQAAGRPLLDSVFGGTLLQTIRCCECGHVSERNEQFLDLSVPVSSNPMSARASAGKGPATMSAHQKKKAEKLAKKNNRRNARQANARKPSESEDKEQLAKSMESLDLSDESECSESEGEEEEEREEAGGDPLDYTKVLVSPPKEYNHERSVGSCLLEFTAEERLAGPNAYECEKCCTPRNKKLDAKGPKKKRVEALKRYLIYEPPCVLTIQLKRFQQIPGFNGRATTRKMGGHVGFPLLFDIAPFCCKNVERIAPGQKQIVYSLYGVVVHSGSLSGGHYIAYVKSRHRVAQAQSFLESARSSCVDAKWLPPPAIEMTKPSNSTPTVADGQWYYCSDSRVNAVSESHVLQAEAYILFYERIV